MKKLTAILVSGLMILGITACGSQTEQAEQNTRDETAVENVEAMTDRSTDNDTAGENAAANDTATDNASQNSMDNAVNSEESPAENTNANTADVPNDTDAQEVKVLVAYFSATNTTKGVAERIANALNAQLYEIVPEEPYTDADLDYGDNDSRSTIEMNDPASRPAISGSVEDMEQYDIVFIGYPIWWGDAPRILSTFVESYDFSGKTIVPFCTSGGSGVGSSATNLEQLTSGAQWLPGRRLNGSDSQDTVMEWVNGLELNLGE